MQARTVSSLKEVDRDHWNALANPSGQSYHPFVEYDFLEALEASGSATPETGWGPRHLLLEKNGTLIAAAPMYAKGHSQGEYIFDHAWADAYERAGGRYYPKLLIGIPFTPVTGPRLLAINATNRMLLGHAAARVANEFGVSSLHVNFLPEPDTRLLSEIGYLKRLNQQFHFDNPGFSDFDDFLETLASRKRKNLRKERAAAVKDVAIEWLTGSEITEAHLDQFWIFYQDTGARKWGRPYLTRAFFSLLIERMADKTLLMLAKRNNAYVAGALHMIGGDTLYGRYWGCTEHLPFLHFELCYYQAIDYAIAHKLKTVEAGAQGEHKIARGYTPVPISSMHWLPDPGFRQAVEHYLDRERQHMADEIEYLKDYTPFRKS